MEMVTCAHTHRDSGCLALARESACPVFAVGCYGCVNTQDNARFIPVQGRTPEEQGAFRALLATVADS
jgi:hypothetical protein